MKTYTEVWNEVYDILVKSGDGVTAFSYAWEQQKNGNLTEGDVRMLIEDMKNDLIVEVIDGRYPHRVPARLWLYKDVVKHDEEWESGDWTLFYIKMDNKYVACAQKDGIIRMCAEYKTKRGFNNWRKTYTI